MSERSTERREHLRRVYGYDACDAEHPERAGTRCTLTEGHGGPHRRRFFGGIYSGPPDSPPPALPEPEEWT